MVLVVGTLVTTTTTFVHASPRLGVMADVGAPDGAVASLVYRPIQALQFHAGVGYNLVSNGMRAGVTLVPLGTWATPTLSLDYGRYAEGDANRLVRMVSGDGSYSSSLLERVGYDYANGHVGIQLGRARATFYLRAGVSRITSELHGLDAMASSSDDASVSVGDSRMTIWTLSARTGFVLYFR